MVFGRSRGVRGHGMDHTNRFPRTLAGFGLTWHGGNRFSCFFGNIGNSLHHQIPPNWSSGLQMGPWISPNTRDFWWNGLRRKSILENDPKMFYPGMTKTSKFVIVLQKWLPFLWLVIVFVFPHPPIPRFKWHKKG